MSELYDRDSVNVEQIMDEIRANISAEARVDEAATNILTLEEAREEAARRIEKRGYMDDLLSFERTPEVMPIEIQMEDLQGKIDEIRIKGVLGPNVPLEGNFLKRFIKRIIRRVIRCVTGPLTAQISEINSLSAQCLQQTVSLLEQQRKLIDDLSGQLSAIRESMNKETLSE